MALTITALSQMQFPIYGGVAFSIALDAGTPLTLGGSYAIYLGPDGTTADQPCYSGVMGQGYTCYPTSVVLIWAVSPLLERASSLYVTLIGPGGTGQLSGVSAIEQPFPDMLWELRRHWPDWYETGPRSLQDEPRQDV